MFGFNRHFEFDESPPPQIGRYLYRVFLIFAVVSVLSESVAQAREQWQIDRPDAPPPIPQAWQTPYAGGQNNITEQFHPGNPDLLNQIAASRIPIGTVLTGVVDSELSSKKSKPGDIFAIVLEDGFGANGVQIVPPGSRIVGAVVNSVSSKALRNGMPGQLTVGLQTLVFPDGRSVKFHGFLDQNPAHEMDKEPKTRYAGFNLGDYGQQVKGMLGSFAGGIGWVHQARMRGKEFKIQEGHRVAVKVNRTINLVNMTAPLGSNAVPGMTSHNQSFGQFGPPTARVPSNMGSVPGLVGPDPDAQHYRNMAPTATPGANSSMVPGMLGAASAPNQMRSNMQVPAPAKPIELKAKPLKLGDPSAMVNPSVNTIPGLSNGMQASNSSINPNQIFQHSAENPLNSMPDPF